jgi:ankyrin repeat protein
LLSPIHAAPSSNDLNTKLLIAVDKNDTKEIRALLVKGANVNQKDEDEDTLLMRLLRNLTFSTDKEILPTVKLLLSKGAKVNVQEKKWGRTPLMIASSFDSPKIVKLLLQHGANVNTRDYAGQTALMSATYHIGEGTNYASPAIIKLLLNYCASINTQDKHGQTALIMAAQLERDIAASTYQADTYSASIVKLLLSRGAWVNLRTYNGNTALKYAKVKGRVQTIKLLRRAGATE